MQSYSQPKVPTKDQATDTNDIATDANDSKAT